MRVIVPQLIRYRERNTGISKWEDQNGAEDSNLQREDKRVEQWNLKSARSNDIDKLTSNREICLEATNHSFLHQQNCSMLDHLFCIPFRFNHQ